MSVGDLEQRIKADYGRGNYQDAIAATEELLALALHPADRAWAMSDYGELLILCGRRKEAERVLNGALELLLTCDSDSPNIFAQGKCLLWLSRLSGDLVQMAHARDAFEKLRSSDIDRLMRASVLSLLAEAHSALGALEEAEAVYRRLEEEAADAKVRLRAIIGRAAVLLEMGRAAEARAACEVVVACSPPPELLSRLHCVLGQAEEACEAWESAAVSFQQSLNSLVSDPELRNDCEFRHDLYRHLGRSLYETGQWDTALSMCQDLLAEIDAQHRHFVEGQMILGHIAAVRGSPDVALTHYRCALSSPVLSAEERAAIERALLATPSRRQ